MLSKRYIELRFYRVLDISMEKSFLQRIFGLGSIYLMSNDQDTPTLEIKNIINVEDVKERLSEIIERARSDKKVKVGEFLDGDTSMMF